MIMHNDFNGDPKICPCHCPEHCSEAALQAVAEEHDAQAERHNAKILQNQPMNRVAVATWFGVILIIAIAWSLATGNNNTALGWYVISGILFALAVFTFEVNGQPWWKRKR